MYSIKTTVFTKYCKVLILHYKTKQMSMIKYEIEINSGAKGLTGAKGLKHLKKKKKERKNKNGRKNSLKPQNSS